MADALVVWPRPFAVGSVKQRGADVARVEKDQEDQGNLVLCVDDELLGLEVRRMVLEHAGYRVLTAETGAKGLAIHRQEQVDAVILDYAMPEMNGAEVAARMRAAKPQVPILLLSAHFEFPAEIHALVNSKMTKGEGAPSMLEKLRGLLAPRSMAI